MAWSICASENFLMDSSLLLIQLNIIFSYYIKMFSGHKILPKKSDSANFSFMTSCNEFRGFWDIRRLCAHSLAKKVLTKCSPQPVVLIPTVFDNFCFDPRWAQQPHPKTAACPTRPGCLRAMPPLLTVEATRPALSKTTTPTFKKLSRKSKYTQL